VSDPQRRDSRDDTTLMRSKPPGSIASLRLPRLAAFTVDGMLGFATVLLVRFGTQIGLVPAFGSWGLADESSSWMDPQVAALTLGLVALRDVPTGASLAKWILCLRVVRPDGRPLGFWQRLARAPFSLLPLAWLSRHVQATLPWRIATYSPSARGLALRTGLAGAVAAASLGWGVDTVRPSIGRGDAERLVDATILSDPQLERALGSPLASHVRRISPRAQERIHGAHARFELVVRGSEMQQDMVVVALKIDGRWVVDEITDIAVREVDAAEPMATR